jgi:acetyl/propionyl-CoA carboxylase alpha subunit
METVEADGSIRPGGGTLAAYEAPSGPGIRTDGYGYAGYCTSGAFDSLLAKVIAHSPRPDFAASVTRAARALSEFRIDGVDTNIPFPHNILAHPDFISGQFHTRWVDDHIAELARTVESRQRYVELPRAGAEAEFAGARVKSRDPLALFEHDAAMKAAQQAARPAEDKIADMIGPDGSAGIASHIQGMIVAIKSQTKISRSVVRSLSLGGADRFKTRSWWRRNTISASRPACDLNSPTYRLFPSLLGAAIIFKPETLVRWHRRVGRPRVPSEIRDLVRTISQDNPLWGAPRIHGELL